MRFEIRVERQAGLKMLEWVIDTKVALEEDGGRERGRL